jgi:hypothetical protein
MTEPLPVTKEMFIRWMTGKNPTKLVNENENPINELVHPLTYSLNPRQYPDMVAIPLSYKFQRQFIELIHEILRFAR